MYKKKCNQTKKTQRCSLANYFLLVKILHERPFPNPAGLSEHGIRKMDNLVFTLGSLNFKYP